MARVYVCANNMKRVKKINYSVTFFGMLDMTFDTTAVNESEREHTVSCIFYIFPRLSH